MKVFFVLVLCGLVSLCCAEPQRYRLGRLRSRVLSRQEAAPSEDPAPTSYPPSGWKPEGATLELPNEQNEVPAPEYGSPVAEYGPPKNEYVPLDSESDSLPAEEFDAEDPEAEAPLAPSSRLRASRLIRLNRAPLRRVQIAPQRVSAKLRRARF